MDSLRVYFKYIFMSLRSQMVYKTSFILFTIGNFTITFIEFLGVYALFSRFGSIKGWTIYEAAVFYGVINCAFAISEGVGRGYDVFAKYVRMGTFDRMLLRPRGLHLQILGSDLQLMRIGRFLQGLLVMGYGFVHLEVRLNLFRSLLLLETMICGVLFFMGLFILQATLSIWSVESLEIVNAFTYGGVQTAQYPINIYKKWFQKIFIYVIPIGCVSYFPLLGVLRNENLVVAVLAPLLGVVFYGLSLLVFKFGVKYYASTGS